MVAILVIRAAVKTGGEAQEHWTRTRPTSWMGIGRDETHEAHSVSVSVGYAANN